MRNSDYSFVDDTNFEIPAIGYWRHSKVRSSSHLETSNNNFTPNAAAEYGTQTKKPANFAADDNLLSSQSVVYSSNIVPETIDDKLLQMHKI